MDILEFIALRDIIISVFKQKYYLENCAKKKCDCFKIIKNSSIAIYAFEMFHF